jgi:hypothetical protein
MVLDKKIDFFFYKNKNWKDFIWKTSPTKNMGAVKSLGI